MKTAAFRVARLIALTLLAAAAGAQQLKIDTNRVPAKRFSIRPSETKLPSGKPIGQGGTWAPDRGHEACRPGLATGASLVVFLPGCGGQPAGYADFLETACDQGFHVIGLDYPNDCGMNNACGSDPGCPGSYRHEVAFGKKSNTLLQLGQHPQDAINMRLKAVLRHLENKLDPQGGWEQFLADDKTAEEGLRPRYDRMVFAGHSLGGGYAAYFGVLLEVRRVVMIENPADALDDCIGSDDPKCTDKQPRVVNWLKGRPKTPRGSFHGLVHRDDVHENKFQRVIASWDALGVPKTQRHVADEPCRDHCTPKQGSDPCGFPCDPHNATSQLPERYRNTWIQMLGQPAGRPVSPPH